MLNHTIAISILILLCTYYVTYNIEKHSVHPIYGNYKKLDSDMKKCEPWQACK